MNVRVASGSKISTSSSPILVAFFYFLPVFSTRCNSRSLPSADANSANASLSIPSTSTASCAFVFSKVHATNPIPMFACASKHDIFVCAFNYFQAGEALLFLYLFRVFKGDYYALFYCFTHLFLRNCSKTSPSRFTSNSTHSVNASLPLHDTTESITLRETRS